VSPLAARRPADVVPARPQALWGWLAVANFVAGGLGAGLYLAAVASAGFGRAAGLTAASAIAPALVLAGFAAVAQEAGRPWRGPRVLRRVRTSWMSREAWAGGSFVVLALGEFVFASPAQRLLAAGAAATLAIAHGAILRQARGVPAWSVAPMPALFLLSALASGIGLFLLLELLAGRVPGRGQIQAALLVLLVDAATWGAYLAWSREPAFRDATAALRGGPLGARLLVGAFAAPAALLLTALAWPLAFTLALAALLLMLGQADVKAALVRDAGRLRPITLPHLPAWRKPA
jgi:formate-dependent nitrite reductase membrane component NrfD